MPRSIKHFVFFLGGGLKRALNTKCCQIPYIQEEVTQCRRTKGRKGTSLQAIQWQKTELKSDRLTQQVTQEADIGRNMPDYRSSRSLRNKCLQMVAKQSLYLMDHSIRWIEESRCWLVAKGIKIWRTIRGDGHNKAGTRSLLSNVTERIGSHSEAGAGSLLPKDAKSVWLQQRTHGELGIDLLLWKWSEIWRIMSMSLEINWKASAESFLGKEPEIMRII
jgi:hypothetical protein